MNKNSHIIKPFMGCLILLLAISLAVAPGYPSESIATSDDCRSLFLNPAGLALEREMNGMLSFSLEEELEEISLSWQTKLGGLGYRERDGLRSYLYGIGFEVIPGVYLGLRSRWIRDKKAKYFSLDSGLLYRPTNYLSLGLVGNYLNRPQVKKSEYLAGLGLRPSTDRVTLFAQRSLEGEAYRLGGQVEILEGIFLSGFFDNEGFNLGVTLQFPQLGMGISQKGVSRRSFEISFSRERARTILSREDKIAGIVLEGLIEEERGFSLLGGSSSSSREIMEQLEKAKEDSQIKGVIIQIRPFGAGLAILQEIREKIEEVKKEKKVVAYLEAGGGDAAFYLASAAHKVVVAPAGLVAILGPRTEILMLKGLLEKLGMEADYVRSGKYKSAIEPLTQEELSPEAKEEYQVLIDDFHDQLSGKIAEGRNLTREELGRIMDEGPMWAEEAREAGLVDEVGYDDEAKSLLIRLCNIPGKPDELKLVNLKKRRYRSYRWVEPPKVAIIQASGAIVLGKSGGNILDRTRYLGSDTLIEQIRKARKDKTIKAIVIRVDSPGGSGIASDLIWREIQRTKEEKPVVISMGNLAASGGYYISSSANKIVANPGTLTGSIGCLSGKIALKGTYEKLGINPEVIKRGEHADMFSPSRKFTEEEREKVQRLSDLFYDKFLDRVARGRKMKLEEVEKIAQGRIYTGNQAIKIGLVDKLGGLCEAVNLACQLARIEEKPKLIYLRPEPPFLLKLMGLSKD